jgi:hypothetical protein
MPLSILSAAEHMYNSIKQCTILQSVYNLQFSCSFAQPQSKCFLLLCFLEVQKNTETSAEILPLGTDVMILKNILAEKIAIVAFVTQNKAKLCKILIITLVFVKNANFLPKIGKNRRKL